MCRLGQPTRTGFTQHSQRSPAPGCSAGELRCVMHCQSSWKESGSHWAFSAAFCALSSRKYCCMAFACARWYSMVTPRALQSKQEWSCSTCCLAEHGCLCPDQQNSGQVLLPKEAQNQLRHYTLLRTEHDLRQQQEIRMCLLCIHRNQHQVVLTPTHCLQPSATGAAHII